MKRALVFTGLIRDENKFLSFLDQFAHDPACHQVKLIFSTWLGELDGYPAVRERLQALKATVIEQSQPDLKLKGHALHQIATLDLALAGLDDQVFVFKSRPDFAFFPTFRLFLNYTPRPTISSTLRALLPAYRFLIVGLFPAHPFYINDITFAGMCGDMRRLAQLSLMDMVRYARLAPEQLIWAPQFLRRSGPADGYFRVNFGLIFGDAARSQRSAQALRDSHAYRLALAFYFTVLEQSFDFFDAGLGLDPDEVAKHSLESILWGDITLSGVRHNDSCVTNHANTGGVMAAIFKGAFATSEFGTNVLDAMARIRSDGGILAPGVLDADLERLSQRCGEELNIFGAKHVRSSANGRQLVHGIGAEWEQVQLGTSLTQRLEEEINYLRRSLNALEHKMQSSTIRTPTP